MTGTTVLHRLTIEEIVAQTPAVRYSAAVGVDQERMEGEQVYIFAEIRDGNELAEDQLHDHAINIVSTIHTRMGYRPGRVYLLKPHAIPLTHNGKIQYLRLKEQYLDGYNYSTSHK